MIKFTQASGVGLEAEIVALYEKLISAWNTRNAVDFGACFEESGSAIGYDGSQMDGRDTIGSSLSGIFRNHKTARYVTIIREIREIGSEAAILRAVVGMIPEGSSQINSSVNAIQSVVTRSLNGAWRITLLQNTPAAFHGRPELSEALTRELQAAYDAKA